MGVDKEFTGIAIATTYLAPPVAAVASAAGDGSASLSLKTDYATANLPAGAAPPGAAVTVAMNPVDGGNIRVNGANSKVLVSFEFSIPNVASPYVFPTSPGAICACKSTSCGAGLTCYSASGAAPYRCTALPIVTERVVGGSNASALVLSVLENGTWLAIPNCATGAALPDGRCSTLTPASGGTVNVSAPVVHFSTYGVIAVGACDRCIHGVCNTHDTCDCEAGYTGAGCTAPPASSLIASLQALLSTGDKATDREIGDALKKLGEIATRPRYPQAFDSLEGAIHEITDAREDAGEAGLPVVVGALSQARGDALEIARAAATGQCSG